MEFLKYQKLPARAPGRDRQEGPAREGQRLSPGRTAVASIERHGPASPLAGWPGVFVRGDQADFAGAFGIRCDACTIRGDNRDDGAGRIRPARRSGRDPPSRRARSARPPSPRQPARSLVDGPSRHAGRSRAAGVGTCPSSAAWACAAHRRPARRSSSSQGADALAGVAAASASEQDAGPHGPPSIGYPGHPLRADRTPRSRPTGIHDEGDADPALGRLEARRRHELVPGRPRRAGAAARSRYPMGRDVIRAIDYPIVERGGGPHWDAGPRRGPRRRARASAASAPPTRSWSSTKVVVVNDTVGDRAVPGRLPTRSSPRAEAVSASTSRSSTAGG